MTWFEHLLLFGALPLLIPMAILVACMKWGKAGFDSDYPDDIRAAMPEFTIDEKRRGWILGGLYLVSLLAVVFIASWTWVHDDPARGFWPAFTMALATMAVGCLYDLILIDWGLICWWRPNWVVIPGTEDCDGWGDYLFHVKAQLSPGGLAALFGIPAVLAGLVTLLG